jgi:hypothetical protein
MQIDKSFVIDHLREAGENEKVQHALDKLPEKIDHEQHAELLKKVGVDPGELVEKAAKRGLGSL